MLEGDLTLEKLAQLEQGVQLKDLVRVAVCTHSWRSAKIRESLWTLFDVFQHYNYFMPRKFLYLLGAVTFAAFLTTSNTAISKAGSGNLPRAADSPYDLIEAVNALRASYGLAPYTINSILMYTAQAQADFMAATGDVTHAGPGGIGLTARLLAAGYPLGGDLSAGGFRAENITSGAENRTAQSAVEGWTGDALHLNTMISPNLSEIGAGVTVAKGRVYFVIDCALPNMDGLPQSSTSVPGSGSALPSREVSIAVVSTPNSDGDVIHEVKQGQSLWQIAIAYDVKVDDIKRLNNLSDDNIYPGNKLLVKQNAILATPSSKEISTKGATAISTSTRAASTSTAVRTPVSLPTQSPSQSSVKIDSIMGIVAGILVLALLGGGVFSWLGSKKRE